MLVEKIKEAYSRGVYNLAPPNQIVKYLSESRTLFLCDAELSDEDIFNISSFLSEKGALNHVEHVRICRTSSTQVNYRRNSNSRDINASSLNCGDFKLFKDLIKFIQNSKALKSLSFQNIEIKEEIVILLSSALEYCQSPIHWLSFVSCNFGGDFGMKVLTPSIGRMRSLSVLSIEQCSLTDNSIPFISSIIKAHSSTMDSLFWNTQLRSNYAGVGVPDDVDQSVLGLGLVAVSLFGNRIEGENIEYLIKVLRDNYWLLGLNIAENKLCHTAVAVMMNDLLTSSNKMRAVLLKDNPGLQPYTAKSLYFFMENSAIVSSQQSQLHSPSNSRTGSCVSMDGKMRLKLLPAEESQLLAHWTNLQLLEATEGVGKQPVVEQIKNKSSAKPVNTLTNVKSTTSTARRYVSPARSRYTRDKQDRLEQKPKYRPPLIHRPYSHVNLYGTVEFARDILDKKTLKELDAMETVPRSSKSIRDEGELRRKYNHDASELYYTQQPDAVLDLLSLDQPTRAAVATADANRQKYRYEDDKRGSRRSSDASQLSELSRRIGREQKPRAHRSPVPGARTTRLAQQSSPTRRFLSVSTGRDRLANQPRYAFYDRVLHHRALAVDREVSTERQRSASSKVRNSQAASFDAEELREKSVYYTSLKPRTQKRSGDRSHTDSEQSDMTSMDRDFKSAGEENPREKKTTSKLDQCIASMLQASSHLEDVSQKLQGVVETLSESMNISLSMQRQQLLHSTQDSIVYTRDERDPIVVSEEHQIIRNEEQQKHSNTNILSGSFRGDLQNVFSVSDSQSNIIFDEPDHVKVAASSEMSQHAGNQTQVHNFEEGELSALIKDRMRKKLRMLLTPEFQSN